MTEATKRYLTPREMAESTGLSLKALRRAITNGEMPAIRIGKGHNGAIHVRVEVFEQWLLHKEQQSEKAEAEA